MRFGAHGTQAAVAKTSVLDKNTKRRRDFPLHVVDM